MDGILKVVGIIFICLMVAAAVANWPLWIPFVLVAAVLIAVLLRK